MSLPRFIVPAPASPLSENLMMTLDAVVARHLIALRMRPGAALELLLGEEAWKADLAELAKERALVRLVAPLTERREPPVALHACLPLTAQLSLWDDWLPGVVELGATLIQPVIYARSEYDAKRTAAKRERWERLILAACEQSHRNRVPSLAEPVPFQALTTWEASQKWVAYECAQGESNPVLRLESLAFTHGPEGGIAQEEFQALQASGWQSLTLGRSILRAVTCPAAMLGAIQYELGKGEFRL